MRLWGRCKITSKKGILFQPYYLPYWSYIMSFIVLRVHLIAKKSSVKQTDLFKTLQALISQGIVEKSQSPHYSQILMVPKADGTFCMCVNRWALNDRTADTSWPIPNIAGTLRRICGQRPKIFGIMDLKQDYHQAPLTLATRAYTAIVTFPGVYQPFGPKRAPSYFHETMATAVFIGLIYVICEMYLDDCAVFGDINIGLMSRLKLSFVTAYAI